MKIAIVEDSPEASQTLARLITNFCNEQDISLELIQFSDGIEIVDNYQGNYDVIYFDVEMPIMDGMTAAKKIRKVDTNVIIIFLTNYVQWAIEGYAVEAADFLLKPITRFNFQEHFKRVLERLNQSPKESYTLKTNSGIRKIFLDDLFFVESEGHYLHFHSVSGDYTVLDSMKNVENQLKDKDFFRSNNGYLVNLKHVKSIDGNMLYLDKYELIISRPRKKDFMQALTNYLGADMN
ncbi:MULTISPECIES: LytTR family transcriptional regulator DNA-binding domain-containing protein [Enterococcus]|uniref:LytR/AlgR family response regulator transcription factor n=1 Tax=Enterococcus sp. AZ103 TaxID=2774628 RepID=UPI003F1ECBFE